VAFDDVTMNFIAQSLLVFQAIPDAKGRPDGVTYYDNVEESGPEACAENVVEVSMLSNLFLCRQ
jgi:hypothetical protein